VFTTKSGAWLSAIAFALVALFAFQRISDMDAGWLLALGRLIARGGFPRTNALAWTARDYPWYPTSWLFELTLYLSERALGVIGMQLLTFALTLLTLTLGIRAAERNGASSLAARAAALLSFAVLWTRVVPRPHLFEYALLALMMERSSAAIAKRSSKPLWAMPLAVLVWANAHQSAPFGVGLLILMMVPAVFGPKPFPPGDQKQFGAVVTLCAAATVITPGFDLNLRDLFAHLTLGEYAPIQEYTRPNLSGEPNIALITLAAILGALVLPEARGWLLPTVAFGGAAFLLGRRFGADAAVVGLVPIALLIDRLRPTETRLRALGTGAVTLCICSLLLIGSRVPVTMLGHFLGPSWERSRLPVAAAAELSKLGLSGGGFSSYRFGGYLAWTLPENGDFQDSRPRAFPRAFWSGLGTALQSQEAFCAYLDQWKVSWALTTAFPDSYSGYGLLRGAPGWRLLRSDATAELYVRTP
jgi:hypothetical protein